MKKNILFILVMLFVSIGSFAQEQASLKNLLNEAKVAFIDKKFVLAGSILQRTTFVSKAAKDSITYYQGVIEYYSAIDTIIRAMREKHFELGQALYHTMKTPKRPFLNKWTNGCTWVDFYNCIPTVMSEKLYVTPELSDSLEHFMKNGFKVTKQTGSYSLGAIKKDIDYTITPECRNLLTFRNKIGGVYFTFDAQINSDIPSTAKQTITAVVKALCSYIYFDLSGTHIQNVEVANNKRRNTQYSYVQEIDKNLIWDENEEGKVGFVDSGGNMLIPYNYNVATDFSEGFSIVWRTSNLGYMDIFGNTTFECTTERLEKARRDTPGISK